MKKLIVAIAQNGVIGKNNALPWNIPEDLKHFRDVTKNSTVIMGRKTYESIGRPLPNRENIVVSQTLVDNAVIVCKSLDDSFARATKKDIFVIGGARVYKEALHKVDQLIISEIHGEYQGDTYFPDYDKSKWHVIARDKKEGFDVVTYERC